VTGIRHDAYADAHRVQVEVKKPPQDQGRYLHPELFGAPAEQAIGYVAPPDALQAESDHLALLQERHWRTGWTAAHLLKSTCVRLMHNA
jgi:hypothetical protein